MSVRAFRSVAQELPSYLVSRIERFCEHSTSHGKPGLRVGPVALLALLVGCSADAIPTSPEGPEQNRLVAKVEVEPRYLQIGPDDLGSFEAVVKSARGRVVNGRQVRWSSADPSVVSIEPDGTVTGVNEGETEIYADVEDRRGSAAIKVRGTVVGIELPDVIVTSQGAARQLEARLRYANGAFRPVRRARWSSEDPGIATIDGDGLLRGRSTGSTKIVAFARGHSKESGVEVKSSAVASIQLSADSLELEPGETHQLWVELYDAQGNRLDKQVVWSSLNPTVATVNSDGLVTAIAVGSAVIEAKSGGETATADVRVVESGTTTSTVVTLPAQVTDLKVTGANDHSVTLSFTQVNDGAGSPADYVVRYSLPPIAWSSASDVSKGSCAGSVSGTSIGASLSCTVDALQASTKYEFQVVAYRGTLGSDAVFGALSNVATGTTDDPPVFVDVTPSFIELDEGQTGKLDAEVTDAYGNPVDGYTVGWSSSNTTVAAVDQEGWVTGESAGDATITASVDGDSDSATASVQDTTTSSGGDDSSGSDDGGGSSSGSSSFDSPLVSFAGAEGWGAEALNPCRSLPGELRFVTNLNDSGAGSLRDAVENSRGDRYTIVVFRTGGTIELSSVIRVAQPCIYIAGQTAPGGGVLLKQTVRDNTISVQAEQVAIRYLRLRHTGAGSKGGSQGYVGVARMNSKDGGHVIIDHVSGSWTRDDGLSLWRSVIDCDKPPLPLTHVTVQRSIMAEGLADHSIGGLYGGTDSCNGHEGVYRITWHHNLFATNSARSPSGSSSSAQATPDRGAEIINNVVYNFGNRITSSVKNTVHDFVNNYYRHGPHGCCDVKNLNRHMRHPKDEPENEFPDASIYVEGNAVPKATFSNQWELVRDWWDLGSTLPLRMRRSTRLPQPPFPVLVESASSVWSSVLADVGANARLDCRGEWVANPDAVDERVVGYTRNDNGPSQPPLNPSDVGGFPTIAKGTACTDADSDGMPDEWESLHGVSNPWADRDGDGYLNIEEYLNGTIP